MTRYIHVSYVTTKDEISTTYGDELLKITGYVGLKSIREYIQEELEKKNDAKYGLPVILNINFLKKRQYDILNKKGE